MDLGIFKETKITKEIYTHECSGYRVVTIEAPGAHIGSVAVFYRGAERLDNIGRRRRHHPAALGARASGGWRFQHQPACARGLGAGHGNFRNNDGGRDGGHDITLSPMAQAVV